MTATKTIAITGANGFVGSALTSHFAAQGWHVIALMRRPPVTPKEHIEYHHYDLAEPLKSDLLQGVDYVVHAAYIPLSPTNPDAYTLNKQGATALLKQARAQGTKVIFISSLSAQAGAQSSYGKQKYEIEQILSSTEAAVRPGLIIGNGGLVRDMAAFVQKYHAAPLIGGGTQPLQIIGIGELVTGIDLLIQKNLHGVFTLASDTSYTYKSFYRALAARLDIRLRLVPLPFWAAHFLVWAASAAHLHLGITQDSVNGLKKMRRLSTETDLKVVGLSIRSLDDALAKTDFTL